MPEVQISYVPDVPAHSNDVKDTIKRTFVLDIDKIAYESLLHSIQEGQPNDLNLKRHDFEILTFHDGAALEPATSHDLWHGFGHKDEFHVAYIIAQKGQVKASVPKPTELHNEIFA